MSLTSGKAADRKRRFIAAYAGDAVAAYRAAGFVGTQRSAEVGASRYMKDPEIQAALAKRDAKRDAPLVASRTRRQEYWTSVMEDVTQKQADRLRASELLAKSGGDFLERIEVSAGATLEELILKAAGK